MIAAGLPEGSIVAAATRAGIKNRPNRLAGQWNWVGSLVTDNGGYTADNEDVQAMLDSGAATVLRVGTETDDAGWQWGTRTDYHSGDAVVYDHAGERAARNDLAGLKGEPYVANAELVRRWHAAGEWETVDEQTPGGAA